MDAKWIKTRQTKFAAYVTVYILVTLAVLTVLNILANRYDKSYDSTKNKQFSLSDQTIKIVKGLKLDVTATYFGSEDSFRTGRDLLDRYSSLSPKFHVKYLAPDRSIARRARSASFTTHWSNASARFPEWNRRPRRRTCPANGTGPALSMARKASRP